MSVVLRQVLLIGATVGGLVTLACMANARGQRLHSEELLDTALDETYPASDPTASQDFAIPVNRR